MTADRSRGSSESAGSARVTNEQAAVTGLRRPRSTATAPPCAVDLGDRDRRGERPARDTGSRARAGAVRAGDHVVPRVAHGGAQARGAQALRRRSASSGATPPASAGKSAVISPPAQGGIDWLLIAAALARSPRPRSPAAADLTARDSRAVRLSERSNGAPDARGCLRSGARQPAPLLESPPAASTERPVTVEPTELKFAAKGLCLRPCRVEPPCQAESRAREQTVTAHAGHWPLRGVVPSPWNARRGRGLRRRYGSLPLSRRARARRRQPSTGVVLLDHINDLVGAEMAYTGGRAWQRARRVQPRRAAADPGRFHRGRGRLPACR